MAKSITHLFNHTLIIQRLKATSGYKKSFSSTATVDGMLQEKFQEANQRLGIIESRSFMAWVDISEDVQEGDRISHTLNGRTTLYLVKVVTQKDYGINTHLQLILEKANE
jgi:hypothetical protein